MTNKRTIWVSFQINEDLAGPILADLADRDVQNLSFGLAKRGRPIVQNGSGEPEAAAAAMKPNSAKEGILTRIKDHPDSYTAKAYTALKKHPEGLSRDAIRDLYVKAGGAASSTPSFMARLIHADLLQKLAHDLYALKGP